MKDETYELLDDMYSEFLPAFTSKFFNICSDETYDLGKGTSKKLADEIGVGRVYLNHILRVHDIAKKYGIEQNLNRYEELQKHYDSLLERLEERS